MENHRENQETKFHKIYLLQSSSPLHQHLFVLHIRYEHFMQLVKLLLIRLSTTLKVRIKDMGNVNLYVGLTYRWRVCLLFAGLGGC